MALKSTLKRTIQELIPTRYPAFVISSFGRSGSTLVNEAVLDGLVRAKFGRDTPLYRKISRGDAWNLEATALSKGVIYKTHDYPEALRGRRDTKAIFLFGSAAHAALSVKMCQERYGDAWISAHFEHLQANGSIEDLFDIDVLGFSDQINAWTRFDGIPVLCLRYEKLWENESVISKFCGFEVKLPRRADRKAVNVEYGRTWDVDKVYGPIDETLARLPDAFIAGSDIEHL